MQLVAQELECPLVLDGVCLPLKNQAHSLERSSSDPGCQDDIHGPECFQPARWLCQLHLFLDQVHLVTSALVTSNLCDYLRIRSFHVGMGQQ